MEIWGSFAEAAECMAGRRTALTIGTFDGVHLGHQRVIEELCREARQRERLLPVVVTFADHPAAVVSAGAPPLLTTLEQRLALLGRLGVEAAVVVPFSDDLALTGPAEFVRERLRRDLQVAVVVVGHDFRFGARGAGDAAALSLLGAVEGFTVRQVPPVVVDGVVVSSTAIRWALAAGEIQAANAYLGRPFSLRGVVRHGTQRGRGLGYPTANLTPPRGILHPRYGVYLVGVRTEAGDYTGVANVGVKPTFGRHEPIIEVYLLDYRGDLYGTEVEVAFRRFLRPERAFPDAGALQAQIEEDVRQARTMAAAPADPSTPCLHWI